MGVLTAETMTTGSFNMAVSSVSHMKVESLRSSGLGKQLAADQPAADLGSSRADLVELGVAPQAPGRCFVDVAHPAQALDCFATHPGGFFRSVEDRPGGVLTRSFIAVAGLPDRVDVGAAGVERRIHVGELSLHPLKLADRLAELLALMEVRDDHVHAGLHDAQGAAGEHRPLVIQS